MDKKEFLAFSLPYGLKCYISNTELYTYYGTFYQQDSETEYKSVKPILHPLSNLTKEIEHDGEKFVPIDVIINHPLSYYDDKGDALISIQNYPEQLRIWTILILIEWHFNIAGLIEKGEAIDINTLTENPYK